MIIDTFSVVDEGRGLMEVHTIERDAEGVIETIETFYRFCGQWKPTGLVIFK